MEKDNHSTTNSDLRQKAELLLKKKPLNSKAPPTENQILKLIQQLDVYQIELQAQSESLSELKPVTKEDELSSETPLKPKRQVSHADLLEIIHELEIHQVELEMQNEELSWANEQAEIAKRKYVQLFDLSQSGFLTLSRNGEIRDLNLSAAKILGKEPSKLKRGRLGFFLNEASKPIFNRFLAKAFETMVEESCELTLVIQDFIPKYIKLNGIVAADEENCLVNLVDISDQIQLEEELLENKAQYWMMTDIVPTMLWMTDADSNCTYFNRVWLDFTGRTMEQEKGLGWREGVHPEDYQHVLDIYTEACSQPLKFEMEYRLRRADGEYRWLLNSGIPQISDKRVFTGYIGCCVDITERKQAEEAQKDALELITKITARVPGFLYQYSLHPDGSRSFPFASDAIYKYFGVGPNEVFADATKLFKSVHPDDIAGIISSIQLSAQELSPWQHEFRVTDSKGTNRTLFSNSLPEREEDGTLNWYGFISDVTNKKLVEEALQNAYWRLESIIEGTHVGTWEWNIQTGETIFNEEWAHIIGYTIDDLAPVNIKTWESLSHPDDLKKSDELLTRHFAGELPYYDFESRMKHKDGHWVWVHARGRVITYDNAGKPLMMFGTHTDITGRKQIEEDLFESEKLFRETQIVAHIASCSYNLQTGTLKSSETLDEILGIDRNNEQTLEGWAEIIHPDYRTDWINYIVDEVVGKRQRFDKDYKIIRQNDGLERWVHTLGEIKLDLNNQPIELFGTIMDITERKQAEKLLQQTRQNFETFFNTVGDFLFILDEQANIIHMNRTVIDRLGYTYEELFGKSVLTVHPPERHAEAGRIVGEILDGLADFCPVPIVTKAGVQIPVETRVRHGIWDGKPVIFGVSSDITRIKLSEEKFSKVFYINPSASSITDTNTQRYVEVNDAFCNLYGFDKSEVIGKTAIELGIISDEVFNPLILSVSKLKRIVNYEASLKTKNGQIKNVLLSIENIAIEDIEYRYTVVNDMTERKLAEVEINLKNGELQRNNAEKDKFFSIIAHDLRSPLSGFLGLTDIMASGLSNMTTAEVQKIANLMKDSASNLFRLLGNLLEWSRMQQGLSAFVPKSTLLMSKISECIAFVEEAATKKLITISYSIPPDLEIFADSNMLCAIIRNIVSNAVKFTPKGGAIKVSARSMTDYSVEISVSDTGIGMNKEMIDHLFRLDTNTNRKGTDGEYSTGLGLIICKDFIKKHGGKLVIESDPDGASGGKGSVFTITFPGKPENYEAIALN